MTLFLVWPIICAISTALFYIIYSVWYFILIYVYIWCLSRQTLDISLIRLNIFVLVLVCMNLSLLSSVLIWRSYQFSVVVDPNVAVYPTKYLATSLVIYPDVLFCYLLTKILAMSFACSLLVLESSLETMCLFAVRNQLHVTSRHWLYLDATW